jgi:DNA-directed RNA polymerase subunit RPC12/RpoP
MTNLQIANVYACSRSSAAAKAPKEDAVAELSETPEKRCQSCGSFVAEKSEKEIDFSHIGGKKVGHLRFDTPVEPAESVRKEISFAHIGGKKVGHRCHSCGRFVPETPEKEIFLNT